MALIRSIVDFFTVGMWNTRLDDQPRLRQFGMKQFRIVILAVREFIEDRCFLRASALTFYSLLSIGPVVALIFGIAKGFGMQKQLETQVIQKVPAQEEVLNQILSYARILLENTRGGVIAGVGVVLLMWSVLKLLNHIEQAFNDIWQIKRPRSWRRRLSNYLAFIVIGPFLLLMYTSIPAFISSQIALLAGKFLLFEKFSPVLFATLKFFPYLLIGGVFTFIYILIPNTRVRFTAGLAGGVVAGSIYLVAQWLYIYFQIGVTRYNPIYGSLAALPLLLIWLNIGWAIILFGAEYSYAHQNVAAYESAPDFTRMSPYTEKILALKILKLVAAGFTAGTPALHSADISQQLQLPTRATRRLLNLLVESGLLVRSCRDDSEDPVYQPASDTGNWTVATVCDAVEKRGVTQPALIQQQELAAIASLLEQLRATVEAQPENVLVKDMKL